MIVTVMGNKRIMEQTIDTYRAFKDNFNILNEYEIDNFNDKVINTYKKYDTKLSFTDCTILETIK